MKKLKNKMIWIMLLCLSASLCCFMGCGTDKQASVKMKVGILRTTDSVPLYAAEEFAYYKKYGVDVELVEFSNAADQSKAMEAGGIDAMMTDMIVQSVLKKGGCSCKAIMIAVGEEISDGQFMVVASKNSPYATREDLKGAKIAISEGTMMEFLLDSYCEELHIDLSEIEKVSVPSLSLRLEMLVEGKDVDCAILPEPLAQFAQSEGGISKIDDTLLDTNLSQTVIAVSDRFIKEHADVVQNFVYAYSDAVDTLNENPTQSRELVCRVANVPEALQDTYTGPHYSKGAVPENELVERIETWMVKNELLKEPFSYEELVDDSFLHP